ncbi:hypothetical protein MMPV_004460 [Pyropia vietnamensis]
MPRVPPVTTLVLHTWREHCKPKPWDRPSGSDGEDDAAGGVPASDAGGGPPLPPRHPPVGHGAGRGRGGRLPYRRSTSVDESLVAGGSRGGSGNGGSGSSGGDGGRARPRLTGSGSGTPRCADTHRRVVLRPGAPSAVLSPSSSEDDLTLGASRAGPSDRPAVWDVPTAEVSICLPAASRVAMRRSVSVDMDLRSDRRGGGVAAVAPGPLRGSVGSAWDAQPSGFSPVGASSSSTMGVTATDGVTSGHSFLADLGGSLVAQLPGGASSSALSASLLADGSSAPRLGLPSAVPSQSSASAGTLAWSTSSRRDVRGKGGRRGLPRSTSTDGTGPALVAAARNLATGDGTSHSGVLFSPSASSGGFAEDLHARGSPVLPVASLAVEEGIDRLPPLPPGVGGGHFHHPYPPPHLPHPPYTHPARLPPPHAVFLRGTSRAMAVDDLDLPSRVAASRRRPVRRSASTDEALEALPPLPPRGGSAPAGAAAASGNGSGLADRGLSSAPAATAAATTGGPPIDGSPLTHPLWGPRATRLGRDEGLCSLGGAVSRVRPPRPGSMDGRVGTSAGGATSFGQDVT